MNRRRWPSLGAAVLATVISGCDDPVAPSSQSFSFHVQSSFHENWVHISLDDSPVFNGAVTTLPQLGLAAVVHSSATKGSHVVKLFVGATETVATFELQAYVYVVVRFDPQTSQAAIDVTDERPVYE